MSEELLTSISDQIGLITLNRPARRNAMSAPLYIEMRDAVLCMDEDPNVRAIVLTGSGSTFCSGADIESLFASQLAGRGETPDWTDWPRIIRSAKPTVAALNGTTLGVGLSLVLPFDEIIAASGSRLGLRFVRMGLVPELGSSNFLPRRVGFTRAAELMITGRDIDATAALDIGLVDQVVDPESLMELAISRAKLLSAGPIRQIRWIKQLLDLNASESSLEAIQDREVRFLAEAFKSPEHAEAISAFGEKREPDFARFDA